MFLKITLKEFEIWLINFLIYQNFKIIIIIIIFKKISLQNFLYYIQFQNLCLPSIIRLFRRVAIWHHQVEAPAFPFKTQFSFSTLFFPPFLSRLPNTPLHIFPSSFSSQNSLSNLLSFYLNLFLSLYSVVLALHDVPEAPKLLQIVFRESRRLQQILKTRSTRATQGLQDQC